MKDDGPHRGARPRTTLVVDPPRRLRRSALAAFAEAAHRAAKLKGEVSVLLTTSDCLQQLNRQYRKKNKVTDVLSFPAPAQQGVPLLARAAGDLAISVDIAAHYAERLGHSLTKELSVLILHGMLHLAGQDHEADNGEMAALEAKLRKRFALPLSLTERSSRVPHLSEKRTGGTAARTLRA